MTDPFSHWMENIPWPISYQISPCIVWCYPHSDCDTNKPIFITVML